MNGLDLVVHAIEFIISPRRCLELADLTSQHTTLKELQEYDLEGWPGCWSECKAGTKEYYGFKDEISVYQGMILKGQRVVIFKAPRPEVLVILHKGYQGMMKM